MDAALSGVMGHGFYKAPGIIVIGALPFDKDAVAGEYKIKDIYITTILKRVNTNGGTSSRFNYNNGVLIYNECLENYTLSPIDGMYDGFTLSYCYPRMGNYINPFVNDSNGFCSWTKRFDFDASQSNNIYSRKIMYDKDRDLLVRAEHLDQLNKDGYLFRGTTHNLTYTGEYLPTTEWNYVNYALYNSEETLTQITTKLKTDSSTITVKCPAVPTDISYSWKEISLTASFKTILVRTDFLPDLDHEADKNIPEICGVYMLRTDIANKANGIGVGSLIMEDKNNKDYRYCGIAEALYKDQISLTKIVEIKDDEGNVTSTKSYGYIIEKYGISCAGSTSRKIVKLYSINTNLRDEHYVLSRMYILEGESWDPLDYKKFWYADLNTSSGYSPVFSTGDGINVVEHTFTYINFEEREEDDEEPEILPDIVLTPIGFSRINPQQLLFGNISYTGTRENNGIYISNWISPVVNIKE